MENFDALIGEPLDLVKSKLEKEGFVVKVFKCSKPKIKTSDELVIKIEKSAGNELVIIAGDFLINIWGRKHGVV